MGKINLTRVLLGGLLAGVVALVGEFLQVVLVTGEQWAAAFGARTGLSTVPRLSLTRDA